jgi:hypothetical protein
MLFLLENKIFKPRLNTFYVWNIIFLRKNTVRLVIKSSINLIKKDKKIFCIFLFYLKYLSMTGGENKKKSNN